jgi:hypothetical protein
VNAAAALRPAAVSVELGDWEYEIPSLPATDWLEALLGGWYGVVPGLLSAEDEISVLRDYRTGAVSKEELLASARAAVEAASGRRWWVAERLISTATNDEFWPTIHGSLVLRGVDLDRLSLGGVLNAIYVVMVENMKEDKRHSFDAQLDAPPPQAVAAEWDDGAAEEDFMAALGEQVKLHGG